MADKLNFELVSPERLLASEACDMVVVPGEEGDLGILVDHAPMVTLLRPGVVAVYQRDTVEQRYFVVGGFAEVNEQGCILLTEEAFDLAEASKDAAARRLDTARRDFDDLTDEGPARERAAKALRVAEALVDVVGS